MTRGWVRELAGWLLAACVAAIAVGAVASSPRAELLFRDGDSLIVAMLSRSISSGQASDWILSSVLFLPETAVFLTLETLTPLDANGLLAVSAVGNLLALYGAIRLVAGRSAPGRAPVAWSVGAVTVFAVLAVTETSASRDALELASLQLTTTYYAATVVATVLAVGLLRRLLSDARHTALLLISLGCVAAASVLTNPLFVAWAGVPLALILALFLRDGSIRTRAAGGLGVMVVGCGLGLLARIPLSAWIANTGAGYAQPERWRESIEYYAALLSDRLETPLGLLSAGIVTGLLALAVVRTVIATHPADRLVAVAAWAIPLIVVIGAVAVGTHAARYLQPALFAPVLALVAAPTSLRRLRRAVRPALAGLAIALVVGGAASVPRIASAATAPDRDLLCVTEWVDSSGRIGAGQFWTVRLPKLHLEDSERLVQVDHRLNAYAWLVDRSDFAIEGISFLVEDAQTVPWDLPLEVVPEQVVDCGRYTIVDFGPGALLPLGPQRS